MITKPEFWRIPTVNETDFVALDDKITTLHQRLQEIDRKHTQVKFANSLAVEDMVITDALAKIGATLEVFTLETGRLHADTLALIDVLKVRYPSLKFTCYYPDSESVADYAKNQGINGFYDSIDARKQCCFIRKVAPLNRALAEADAWLTGQRREQSVTRTDLTFQEYDESRRIAKYNPIYDWSEMDVWAYVLKFGIPFNALYHQGYPSIGCEPCTLPVKAGEDIRSGRWWWENRDGKECGLHK